MHWHSLINSPIRNVVRKIATRHYLKKIKTDGRVLFKDRFGLKYFIYPDMRLSSTIDRGVRTDDEGVLFLIQNLIPHLPQNRPIHGFDLGAYVGVISLFLAKTLSPNGHVHAFEAEPTNFQRLQENIACNDFTNLMPHHLAMWSEKSKELYSRRDPDSGQSDVHGSKSESHIPVSTTTIDHFLHSQKISTIDIMKLDVEGSEPDVLKGAKETLQTGSITFLIFEYIKEDSGRSICDTLSSYGYQLYWIHRNGQISRLTEEVKRKETWGNCLAVSPTYTPTTNLPLFHSDVQ
jgi:FkbM family methyltransferase